MVRQINAGGRAAIKGFESCRLEAYRDAVGVWTIGWGSTHGVHAGMTITQAEAEHRFTDDLAPAETAVSHLVTVPLDENQFVALVSFVFNVGAGTLRTSTLLRLLNGGDYAAVPAELRRFHFAAGRSLDGLKRRREAEVALWQSRSLPPHPLTAPSAEPHPDKPVAPAAAAPASSSAATESKPMNPLTILEQLFGGVAGKLTAAKTVATVAPHVVSGAISSIGEIPVVVKDIEVLIADIKGGKWNDVPNAFEALIAEFGKILGKFGVSLPDLTGMVDQMTPAAVTAGKTVGKA